MAASGECEICGSKEFMLSDGLFFCSECGTQSQNVREEVTEKDETMSHIRTLKLTTKKKEETKEDRAADETIYEKFQLILQLQCDALIELGCDPSLKEAIKLIWFKYLKFCTLAFDESTKSTGSVVSDYQPRKLWMFSKVRRDRYWAAKLNQSLSADGDFSSPTSQKHRRGRPCKIQSGDALSQKKGRRGRPRKKPLGDDLSQKKRPRGRPRKNTCGDLKSEETQHDNPDVGKSVKFQLDSLENGDGEANDQSNALDVFPNDSHLFEEREGMNQVDIPDDSKWELTDEDLYIRPSNTRGHTWDKWRIQYPSLKLVVAICYLGILFTKQNILISDFLKWIRLHKFPYLNLAEVLPRFFFPGKAALAHGKLPLARPGLIFMVRKVFSLFPLPPLPLPDPAPICHTLLDRLYLPPCFHRIIDKTIECVHKPSDFFTDLQLDIRCMSLIVFLMRFIYRLDDSYEFYDTSWSSEMVKLVREEGEGSETEQGSWCQGSDYIYLWEDWVALYWKNKLQSFHSAVPTDDRELQHVTDYNNYVDFCRDQLFSKARLIPRYVGKAGLKWKPEMSDTLSNIFTQHLEKTEASNESTKIKTEPMSEPEFKPPRQILLTDLMSYPEACWLDYRWLRCPGAVHNEGFSQSLGFLLRASSELLEVQPEYLYSKLSFTEISFEFAYNTVCKLDTVMTKVYGLQPGSPAAAMYQTQELSDASD